MAVCKYCNGYGCTNQCMLEKQKSNSMKPIKAIILNNRRPKHRRYAESASDS